MAGTSRLLGKLRLSRRGIRVIVVVTAVLVLLVIGASLKRNQPLPDAGPSATIQVQ